MSGTVECQTHGPQRRTRVCQHIVVTLHDEKPRGFYWTSDDADEPNAWCAYCQQEYMAAGENWTPELMEMVDPKILCFACFQRARRINGVVA